MHFTASEFIKWLRAVKPDAHAAGTINGDDIDKTGFREAAFFLDVAAIGAGSTVDFKVQETGALATGLPDTGNYADVPLALITQIITADKSAVVRLNVEERKQFLRGVLVVAVNPVDASVMAGLIHDRILPVVQSADEVVEV